METQKERLSKVLNLLKRYYSTVNSKKYYPTKKDGQVGVLKMVTENILSLKEIKKDLEKDVEKYIALAESKISRFEGESLSMHSTYFVLIADMSSEELLMAAELNNNVEKEINLQKAKQSNHGLEIGM